MWAPAGRQCERLNPIIYAEVSIRYARIEDVEAALSNEFIGREPIPFAAAFLAGRATCTRPIEEILIAFSDPVQQESTSLRRYRIIREEGGGRAMTIQIELSPETEARLAAGALARGVAVEQYAGSLLQEALATPVRVSGKLTVEEFHAMLSALAEGSEKLPNLPTESFTRESFYEDRT